jgi:hypothetical protein
MMGTVSVYIPAKPYRLAVHFVINKLYLLILVFVYVTTVSAKRDIELALSKASSQLSIGSIENTSDSCEPFCLPVPTYGENERFAYASAAVDLR